MNAIYDLEDSQGRLLRKVIRVLSIFFPEVDIGIFLLVHFSSGIYINVWCISHEAYFEKVERKISCAKSWTAYRVERVQCLIIYNPRILEYTQPIRVYFIERFWLYANSRGGKPNFPPTSFFERCNNGRWRDTYNFFNEMHDRQSFWAIKACKEKLSESFNYPNFN